MVCLLPPGRLVGVPGVGRGPDPDGLRAIPPWWLGSGSNPGDTNRSSIARHSGPRRRGRSQRRIGLHWSELRRGGHRRFPGFESSLALPIRKFSFFPPEFLPNGHHRRRHGFSCKDRRENNGPILSKTTDLSIRTTAIHISGSFVGRHFTMRGNRWELSFMTGNVIFGRIRLLRCPIAPRTVRLMCLIGKH